MRHLRQQIVQRVRNMPAIQPEILIDLIRTALVLIRHTRQRHPFLGISVTVRIQHSVTFRLREAVLVVEGIVEEGVHVDVPDDGVVVFGGEGGCCGFEAGVVVVYFGFFGDGHVPEFGGTVEGRDVVNDDVAGAFLVELVFQG